MEKNNNCDLRYYIGLDIGTNSVGWACTDENYRLLRFKGQNMWGTRLIDDVETAEQRRIMRSARRRYERRRERIRILRSLIGSEILEKDENFFRRLSESFLLQDKEGRQSFGKSNISVLFDDENYKDGEFYKEYPTIYHLRKAIVCNPNKQFDIREIYLTMHHILKFRGNFLYDDDELFNDEQQFAISLESAIQNFFDNSIETDRSSTELKKSNIEKIIEILKNDEIPKYISKKRMTEQSKKTKDEAASDIFDSKEEKCIGKNLVLATLGYAFDFNAVRNAIIEQRCASESASPTEKNASGKMKIKFGEDFDKDKDEIYDKLNEDDRKLLEDMEKCHNSYKLRSVLSGHEYICDAKIAQYEKHKADLKKLKLLTRELDKLSEPGKEFYKETFCKTLSYDNKQQKVKNGINYAMYVKHTKNGHHYSGDANDKTHFYTYIKNLEKEIEKLSQTEDLTTIQKIYGEIRKDVDDDAFMPKLNDVSNADIPYQLHKRELTKIIDNQKKYYPILEKNKDKIISILEFKRPYYIGPLSTKSPFGWTKDDDGNPLFRTDEKIYPWNFDEMIGDKNKEKIQERFIERLSGKCSYFPDEPVLAKCSIRYQAYCVLNELNKIKINKKPISPETKKIVFENLFCKKKKVSIGSLCKELRKYYPNLYDGLDCNDIEGLSQKASDKGDSAEFNNCMGSLCDFKRILGKRFDKERLDDYDEAIRILTIFKDKDIVRKRIKKILCEIDDETLKALSALTYAGWGRYSKKFLDEIRDRNNKTILEELYDGKISGSDKCPKCPEINALIYNEKLGFNNYLSANNDDIERFSFNDHVKNLYCSPSVKSVIWQALRITEEICDILNCKPERIFLETTREDAQKKTTIKRYDELMKSYDAAINDSDIKPLKDELSKLDKNNSIDDKLYLYFGQLGKCMYSGERLSIDRLNDYEIDHIIPRYLIKDNSLSNRVLVIRKENQRKADNLTLRSEIIEKQKGFWKSLLDRRFITKKKFFALTRSEFNDADIEGFIRRQYVETSQIIKEVMRLLERKHKKVFGVRASLISQFRQEQMINGKKGFAKIRGLNDMHHAKDAYLAAALGDFASSTFSNPLYRYDRIKEEMRGMSVDEMIRERNGFVLALLRNANKDSFLVDDGEILPSKLDNIEKTMTKNDCIVTKRIDEWANVDFYNQTILPKPDKIKSEKGQIKLIPLRYAKDKNDESHPLDVNLYGGYTSEKSAYCAIVKCSTAKTPNVIEYRLENIPTLVAYKEKEKEGERDRYIQSFHKGETVKIEKLAYKNQIIKLDGQWVYIVSANEYNNATQFVADEKFDKLLYYIDKYDFVKDNKPLKVELQIRDSDLRADYEKLRDEDSTRDNPLVDQFVAHYVEKLRTHFPLYKKIAEEIDDYKDKEYKDLEWEKKCDYIKKLLIITSTGAGCISKTTYKLKVDWGRIRSRKKFVNVKNVEWLHTSITGLRSKSSHL